MPWEVVEAAATVGLPAPILPSVNDMPDPDELNMFVAGELEAELGRRDANDSFATSLASDERTSVTGRFSVWLDIDD